MFINFLNYFLVWAYGAREGVFIGQQSLFHYSKWLYVISISFFIKYVLSLICFIHFFLQHVLYIIFYYFYAFLYKKQGFISTILGNIFIYKYFIIFCFCQSSSYFAVFPERYFLDLNVVANSTGWECYQ